MTVRGTITVVLSPQTAKGNTTPPTVTHESGVYAVQPDGRLVVDTKAAEVTYAPGAWVSVTRHIPEPD